MDEQELISQAMKLLASKRRFAPTQKPCEGCGREFKARGRGRFCSPACRQKAYREKQKEPSAP